MDFLKFEFALPLTVPAARLRLQRRRVHGQSRGRARGEIMFC